MKRRKPLKKISARRAEQLREYAKVKREWWNTLVYFNGGATPLCEFDGCLQESEKTPHHARGRVHSLLTDTRHWRSLCRFHHAWVHAFPAKARNMGLLCELGKWNTPDRQ